MIATLLPMIFYYLQLGFAPKTLATYFVMGIPGSIFWGCAVMIWGVVMAIVYVMIHQRQIMVSHSTDDQMIN